MGWPRWMKRLVARDELRALDRYRVAVEAVESWRIVGDDVCAVWIREVGEGARLLDIERLRTIVAQRRSEAAVTSSPQEG